MEKPNTGYESEVDKINSEFSGYKERAELLRQKIEAAQKKHEPKYKFEEKVEEIFEKPSLEEARAQTEEVQKEFDKLFPKASQINYEKIATEKLLREKEKQMSSPPLRVTKTEYYYEDEDEDINPENSKDPESPEDPDDTGEDEKTKTKEKVKKLKTRTIELSGLGILDQEATLLDRRHMELSREYAQIKKELAKLSEKKNAAHGVNFELNCEKNAIQAQLTANEQQIAEITQSLKTDIDSLQDDILVHQEEIDKLLLQRDEAKKQEDLPVGKEVLRSEISDHIPDHIRTALMEKYKTDSTQDQEEQIPEVIEGENTQEIKPVSERLSEQIEVMQQELAALTEKLDQKKSQQEFVEITGEFSKEKSSDELTPRESYEKLDKLKSLVGTEKSEEIAHLQYRIMESKKQLKKIQDGVKKAPKVIALAIIEDAEITDHQEEVDREVNLEREEAGKQSAHGDLIRMINKINRKEQDKIDESQRKQDEQDKKQALEQYRSKEDQDVHATSHQKEVLDHYQKLLDKLNDPNPDQNPTLKGFFTEVFRKRDFQNSQERKALIVTFKKGIYSFLRSLSLKGAEIKDNQETQSNLQELANKRLSQDGRKYGFDADASYKLLNENKKAAADYSKRLQEFTKMIDENEFEAPDYDPDPKKYAYIDWAESWGIPAEATDEQILEIMNNFEIFAENKDRWQALLPSLNQDQKRALLFELHQMDIAQEVLEVRQDKEFDTLYHKINLENKLAHEKNIQDLTGKYLCNNNLELNEDAPQDDKDFFDQQNRAEKERVASGELRENEIKYASELSQIIKQHTEKNFEQLANKLHDKFIKLNKDLGLVDSNVYSKSKTWVNWDIAKQSYLNNNPYESSPDYRLADPMTDEQVQQEIVDRHFGWEIYSNGYTQEIGALNIPKYDFLRQSEHANEIFELVGKEPKQGEISDLSSSDLAKLGKLVREALNSQQP